MSKENVDFIPRIEDEELEDREPIDNFEALDDFNKILSSIVIKKKRQ